MLVKRRIFKVFQNASLITQNFLHFLIIHHIHYITFHVENTYSLGDCHVKIFSKTHVCRNEMRQKKFYNVYEDLEVQLSTYTVKESDEGNKIEQRTKNGKIGNVLFFLSIRSPLYNCSVQCIF